MFLDPRKPGARVRRDDPLVRITYETRELLRETKSVTGAPSFDALVASMCLHLLARHGVEMTPHLRARYGVEVAPDTDSEVAA